MNRKELIEAARRKFIPKSGHFMRCPECQEMYYLLRAFPVSGDLPLPDAPKAMIDKAIAISEKSGLRNVARQLKALLTLDSWAMPEPIGVRGGNSLADRRLRFESDEVVFDLRGEKSDKQWIFVARAVGKKTISSDFILGADRKLLQPDQNGIYEWKSGRPPRKMSLNSDDLIIELPELSWKKPRSK